MLIRTAAAALGSTRDETLAVRLPVVGSACVTRGASETARNGGCIAKTVPSPHTQAIPYPTAVRSAQRGAPTCHVWQLANPTPRGQNVTGVAAPSCLPLARTGAPVVDGKAKVGTTLKATKAGATKWTPRADRVSYQWYRGAEKISKTAKAKCLVTAAGRDK